MNRYPIRKCGAKPARPKPGSHPEPEDPPRRSKRKAPSRCPWPKPKAPPQPNLSSASKKSKLKSMQKSIP